MHEQQRIIPTTGKLALKAGAIALIAGGGLWSAQEAHNEMPVAKHTVETAPRTLETPQQFAAKQAEAYVYGLNQKTGDNHVPMRSLNGEIRLRDTGPNVTPALELFPIILSPLSNNKVDPLDTNLEHAWVGVCSYDKNGDVMITPQEFSSEKGMTYVSYDSANPVLEFEAYKQLENGKVHVVAADPVISQLHAPDGTPMSPGLFINK